jgi:hypothetical protein
MVTVFRTLLFGGPLGVRAESDASEMPASGAMAQHTTIKIEDDRRKRTSVKVYFRTKE